MRSGLIVLKMSCWYTFVTRCCSREFVNVCNSATTVAGSWMTIATSTLNADLLVNDGWATCGTDGIMTGWRKGWIKEEKGEKF